MTTSVTTTSLFLALIVLTSSILVLILVYILVRLVNRKKIKACQHQHEDLESRLLDIEDGRQSRLSRQQIQQEHYEDLQQRYSSAPASPFIELLPEIKTSSSEDRASEWLERGNVDEGVDVVSGDLGEKKIDMHPALVIKPKKQLRWDWKDGKMEAGDGRPKIIVETEEERMVCMEYEAEKGKHDSGV